MNFLQRKSISKTSITFQKLGSKKDRILYEREGDKCVPVPIILLSTHLTAKMRLNSIKAA